MYIINYKNLDRKNFRGYSISKNVRDGYYSILGDDYNKYSSLTPNFDFEGKIESEEQIREYIRNYYVNVLSKLDPEKYYENYDYLVTFDDGEFSHGYVVSAWLELFLNVKVPCVQKVECYKKLVDTKPSWVIDVLEDEIKKTIDNMRGFNSVRALYLFMQGEELERKADEIEEKLLNSDEISFAWRSKQDDDITGLRQSACFSRCDADMAEDAWIQRRHKLVEESKKKSRKIEV